MKEEKRRMTKFSTSDDDKLIELVRNHELIYNLSDENYKNFQMRKHVWEIIARELGRTGKFDYILHT